MYLVERLTRVINEKKYHNVTFSINEIPIITANFLKDRKVVILLNNMKELIYHELKFEDNADGSEVMFNTRDEITSFVTLSGITIAQVIGAFVLQLYS